MQVSASGSTGLSKLLAAREERKEKVGDHRKRLQERVQGMRLQRSQPPVSATPTTTRAVEPQGGGAGEDIQVHLVRETKRCELSLPRSLRKIPAFPFTWLAGRTERARFQLRFKGLPCLPDLGRRTKSILEIVPTDHSVAEWERTSHGLDFQVPVPAYASSSTPTMSAVVYDSGDQHGGTAATCPSLPSLARRETCQTAARQLPDSCQTAACSKFGSEVPP